MRSCKNIVTPALCIGFQCLTKFSILQTVCLGCDYYVTIECAQTICAPLLQNAEYATDVRRFSAHTRNRCVIKITKYPDVLALQYWLLFYTFFAIDFSERAIPANINRSILLTARMGRNSVKVALLRCLIRLIIFFMIGFSICKSHIMTCMTVHIHIMTFADAKTNHKN